MAYEGYGSESAYEAAKKRNIINNAQKTFYKNNPDVYKRFEEDWNGQQDFDQKTYIPLSQFERSLLNAVNEYGKLTEKQLAALRKHWATRDEKRRKFQEMEESRVAGLQGTDLEEGRQTITGKIISSKRKETRFGVTTKILIQLENGWRLYGSMPSAIEDELRARGLSTRTDNGERNTTIRELTFKFDAKVSHSGEHGFSFFSRPTKAELID